MLIHLFVRFKVIIFVPSFFVLVNTTHTKALVVTLLWAAILFSLKVMSASFFTFFFFNLKESTFETGKNIIYFTLEASLVFELLKFCNSRILNFMTSSDV